MAVAVGEVGRPRARKRPPGRLKSLIQRFKPKPLFWQRMSYGWLVTMPGKPERRGLPRPEFYRLDGYILPRVELVRPVKPSTPQWTYRVWHPEVFWPDSTIGEKVRKIGQVLWKAFLGYWLNVVFLGFFAFCYYMGTQNPAINSHWDAPVWIVSAGLLPLWTWVRHLIVRDAGEWLFRLSGGWLAFTNPLSPGRQHGESNGFQRALEKTKVIPSEAEPDEVPWYRRLAQLVLSPLSVYVAALPGLLVVFGAVALIGLFNSHLYATIIEKAPNYAATLGALMFGKMVFSKLAIAFQALLIDLFNDHDWEMKWWMGFPSTIRSYQASGRSPQFEGAAWWRGPILVTGLAVIFGGFLVGHWILGNIDYLGTHTLFSQVGFEHMLHTLV